MSNRKSKAREGRIEIKYDVRVCGEDFRDLIREMCNLPEEIEAEKPNIQVEGRLVIEVDSASVQVECAHKRHFADGDNLRVEEYEYLAAYSTPPQVRTRTAVVCGDHWLEFLDEKQKDLQEAQAKLEAKAQEVQETTAS